LTHEHEGDEHSAQDDNHHIETDLGAAELSSHHEWVPMMVRMMMTMMH